MRYEYKTSDICSQLISFDIDGNIIRNIDFYLIIGRIPTLLSKAKEIYNL